MKFKKRNRTTTAAEASRQFDRWLTGGLIGVAAAAAALPWYVFLNPEKFGMSGRGWEALMNVPQRGGGGGEAVIPHGDDTVAETEKDATVDNVITATVPALDKDLNSDNQSVQQPFPGGANFKLLHVSNGRALIEDKSGMFLVQIGSVLPDESKLLSMTKVEGRWKIVTSAGELYSE